MQTYICKTPKVFCNQSTNNESLKKIGPMHWCKVEVLRCLEGDQMKKSTKNLARSDAATSLFSMCRGLD